MSGAISGVKNVGGLIGWGNGIDITSSYATGGAVSGDDNVGALVGDGGTADIVSSYASGGAVISPGIYVGGLVGFGNVYTSTSSYWDSNTSEITNGGGINKGEARTTEQLQSPTDFAGGIYASWSTYRCGDGSLAWNLGTSTHYPALTCTPDDLTAQRSFVAERLRAIPEDSGVTLIWDNPYADIESISISYQIGDSDVSQELPLITSGDQLKSYAKNVQHAISDLDNEGYYNFTISLTLKGEDEGREGEAPSITVAIGPNLDKDNAPDFIDVDVDGNGLIEIATAEEFNQVRHNLLGSGFQASAEGEIDTTGCEGHGSTKRCNGYEPYRRYLSCQWQTGCQLAAVMHPVIALMLTMVFLTAMVIQSVTLP